MNMMKMIHLLAHKLAFQQEDGHLSLNNPIPDRYVLEREAYIYIYISLGTIFEKMLGFSA